MAPGPVVSPVQRISRGVSKLGDKDPSNNLEGMKDIAVGAASAISITGSMLDQYLQRNGMDLAQISLPGLGGLNIDRNAQGLASTVVKSAIKATQNAINENSPEEEAKVAAAEKKAKEAEAKEKQAKDIQIAAAREVERKRFMEGKNGLNSEQKTEESFASKEQIKNKPAGESIAFQDPTRVRLV